MTTLVSKSNRLHPAVTQAGDFVFFLARRVYRDRCTQIAASLTYTSLLALVPFFVVSFSIIRGFPVFPELVSSLQTTMLQVFTPDVGEEVLQYIQQLLNKSRKIPVLSFFALIITSVMTLYTIDDTLNRIWRVGYQRRTLLSLTVYLIVILSGPVLIGISLAATTYLLSRPPVMDDAMGANWLASVPWLVTLLAFTAVYKWVPNTHVRWKYALSGGVVAMLLFELAKWGFALYIRWVPTYGLLYGTLAAIPLTLLWIYVSWLVVLIGAETARCLVIYPHALSRTGIAAKQLLGYFLVSRKQGMLIEELAAREYLSKRRLRRIMQQLQKAGLVQQLATGRYDLTAKAVAMSVVELTSALTEQLKSIEI